jgi:hypothetical protein
MPELRIHSGKRNMPRRILTYGTKGVGKSTFASKAPNPVFLPTEEGLNDIDCKSYDLAETFEQYMQHLGHVYTSQHDYRTVVTDTGDWLEQLIWGRVCRDRKVDNIADIGYAKGYDFAITYWRQVMAGLDALRRDRGMMVIVLAHAKIEKFENPETDSYDRYSPRLHKLSSAMLQEWCDEVLFANYKTYTTKSDKGFNRSEVKGVGSGQRVLYTTERPAHVAKNRLGMPDEIPFEKDTAWQEYAKYLPQAQIAAA